jgi:hypothetical protein
MPCEWAYFSLETLRLLGRHAGRKINRSTQEEYVRNTLSYHPSKCGR